MAGLGIESAEPTLSGLAGIRREGMKTFRRPTARLFTKIASNIPNWAGRRGLPCNWPQTPGQPPGSQAVEETTENMRRIGLGFPITDSMEVRRPQFFCTMGNESVEGCRSCLHIGGSFVPSTGKQPGEMEERGDSRCPG